MGIVRPSIDMEWLRNKNLRTKFVILSRIIQKLRNINVSQLPLKVHQEILGTTPVNMPRVYKKKLGALNDIDYFPEIHEAYHLQSEFSLKEVEAISDIHKQYKMKQLHVRKVGRLLGISNEKECGFYSPND
ncbi:hypothetical protein AVEN_275343-1 [Araneus ventricosus]|uniref:Uncharacterized protein n=1 Tax=Araneus ventricosus TaxID=182803 RepID=A0A4Y2N012_ARAVE|nr:hypothetical protein AVEN_275343-1 [Araneus ventricosus]